ncbi:hypothetical protein NE237_016331 [Protea cynaroides]|uniref:Uncharacterized protein n=1 Tax=Protea cynaroides TaxID=273540 RepID=A0A9Q0GPN2_9MAGN|nr:hypothetical protein NE237_016331 [Protea cynaroides]
MRDAIERMNCQDLDGRNITINKVQTRGGGVYCSEDGGSYGGGGGGYGRHEDGWKNALKEMGNLKGWPLKGDANIRFNLIQQSNIDDEVQGFPLIFKKRRGVTKGYNSLALHVVGLVEPTMFLKRWWRPSRKKVRQLVQGIIFADYFSTRFILQGSCYCRQQQTQAEVISCCVCHLLQGWILHLCSIKCILHMVKKWSIPIVYTGHRNRGDSELDYSDLLRSYKKNKKDDASRHTGSSQHDVSQHTSSSQRETQREGKKKARKYFSRTRCFSRRNKIHKQENKKRWIY